MRLVQDFLEATAAATPGKCALVLGERRCTWAEVDALANRLAWTLREHGVRRGDRVVLWGPNDLLVAAGVFAALKADAVFVVVDDRSRPAHVDHVLRDCGARALCTTNRHLAEAPGLLAAGYLSVVVVDGVVPGQGAGAVAIVPFAGAAARGESTPPPRSGIDRDLACLVYTSGSTGGSKGVMCAHHQVDFASGSIARYLGLRAADVLFDALPLAFDYGLYQWLLACRVGATLVLERSFAYPAACLERIAAERVTVLPGVPTVWATLLDFDLAPYDLSALRLLTNTGAALPPNHVERLLAAFPRAQLFAMYGLTETKRTLYLPPELARSKAGSVGIAIPGTEVWIEGADGERLGVGEVGELVVRGGHVMSGYWGDPEATARRFPPGPLPGERVCRTGDLFTRDADGCHWFVGRADDLLKSRGEKIAPVEIERVLHDLPGVREAALVGVPDERLGHRLVAVIVRADPALDERQVLRHCKARLRDAQVPQRVVFAAALPKSTNGKVDRRAIVLPPEPATGS